MVSVHTVPSEIANKVEAWVTSERVPWFYFRHTLGKDLKGRADINQSTYKVHDLPRLTHYFFPNSKTGEEDTKYIQPLSNWVITTLLPNYEVKRVMGNLTTPISGAGSLLNIPHVDSHDPDMTTFLYYVNNSDGKTVFFEGDGSISHSVDPVKGTGVLFPSNTPHAGQVPKINKTRYVINLIFKKKL